MPLQVMRLSVTTWACPLDTRRVTIQKLSAWNNLFARKWAVGTKNTTNLMSCSKWNWTKKGAHSKKVVGKANGSFYLLEVQTSVCFFCKPCCNTFFTDFFVEIVIPTTCWRKAEINIFCVAFSLIFFILSQLEMSHIGLCHLPCFHCQSIIILSAALVYEHSKWLFPV